MFCSNCGCELKDDAKFCPNCGSTVNSKKVVKNKNIYIAMFLSFIFTGFGVIYAGNLNKGLMLVATRIIFPILGYFHPIFTSLAVIFWLWGFYETYKEVKMANGENPNLMNNYKSLNPNNKAILIVFILLILILSVFVGIGSHYVPDYSSSDSSDYYVSSDSGGSSGSQHSSHYGGVDTSPSSILRDDPDWYYDHYDYEDDFGVDEYLESEGYD